MADYDVSKLTKLEALKQLAARVKEDYATKTELNTVSEKVNAIKVPTKVSELNNDSKFQKDTEVAAAIQAAISESGHAVFEKADKIPNASSAKSNVLYLVYNNDTKHYDIYALIDSTVELLDDTTVDLSKYSTTEQINALLNGYVQKNGSKQLSDENYTSTEKQKLANIADGANNYTHPTSDAGAKTSDLYKIVTDATGHVVGATAVVKDDITKLGIPAQDTTYNPATSDANGLMSSTDKAKLDGIEIASSAEVTAMLNEVFG